MVRDEVNQITPGGAMRGIGVACLFAAALLTAAGYGGTFLLRNL